MSLKNIKIKEMETELLPHEFDVVICCGGFEERVLGILRIISDRRIDNLVLLKYKTDDEHVNKLNSENYDNLNESLTNNAKRVIVINNSVDNPLQTIEELNKIILEKLSKSNIRILLDISGCNDALIHNFMHLFLTREFPKLKIIELHLLYTKPEGYFTNGEMITPYVRETHHIPNFHGFIDPLKRDCLLIFIGFENLRSAALIRYYSPVKAFFIVNETPKQQIQIEYSETAKLYHNELIEEEKIELKDCSFFDLKKIIKTLRTLTEENKKHNIIIGCFGSKIQSVATSIVASYDDTITISTARPHKYIPSNYTFGIGDSLIYRIIISK